MNDAARDRILARLRSAPREEVPSPEVPASAAPVSDRGTQVARLKSLMEAMRTEVHVLPRTEWVPRLQEVLRARAIKTLLYAPGTEVGAALRAVWDADASGLPELVAYTEPVEAFKEQLFAVDAAVTSAAGAVADTGAIILRPDIHEPRSMSLVPPIHIAVLKAESIFPSLAEAMQEGSWSADMPTNMLLVSGPSKTADIELILAFGVHGPKELVVLILE
jgi:L-lactate dehydrogenase complex protein LldG